METFYISLHGVKVIQKRKPQSGAKEGFEVFVLGPEEWDKIPNMLSAQIQASDWLERLRVREAGELEKKAREGSLHFRPHFDRLNVNVHYVCFRDIDEHKKERPIRLFLTSNVCILLGWSGLTQEHLTEWVQSGTLITPLDLACALGLRVLRHHQKYLEMIEDQMDLIEEKILLAPLSWQLKQIISLRRKILVSKRSLNAHQSVFERFKNIQKPQFGDLQEELILEMTQASLSVHQTHEMIESLREAYQAAVDNRANDIMKVLTLVATIILPITLLTGFFGMNFKYMPSIYQPYGIVIFYGLSALIFLVVMIYFWKKKWLH
ncbi:MAG TPA: CorA family divalent cation transporter [Desulfosporosinus sp.]|nr:CorA family divalent cation transporter [Desulfosporosinus sp.]